MLSKFLAKTHNLSSTGALIFFWRGDKINIILALITI